MGGLAASGKLFNFGRVGTEEANVVYEYYHENTKIVRTLRKSFRGSLGSLGHTLKTTELRGKKKNQLLELKRDFSKVFGYKINVPPLPKAFFFHASSEYFKSVVEVKVEISVAAKFMSGLGINRDFYEENFKILSKDIKEDLLIRRDVLFSRMGQLSTRERCQVFPNL